MGISVLRCSKELICAIDNWLLFINKMMLFKTVILLRN